VPVEIGRSKILLVDTPGFDDSVRTDSEILTGISEMLTVQYEAGIILKGVIYLHRITDIRYAGSQIKTLNIFKKICGTLALKNVLLVSTRWHEVDEALGASREGQLREEFWAYMLGHGATMTRFYGDRDSAIGIASQLVSKTTIMLEIQRELVHEGKTLKETAAGAYVNDDIAEMKAQHEEEMREIEHLRQTLRDHDRAMKRRVQQDWEQGQKKLQTAQEDEIRLRRDIAAEVRAAIEQEKGKKKWNGKKIWKAGIPVLGFSLDIIGIFVGIPPGSFSLLTSWLSLLG